ncbi:MAG: RidA family protein [Alphaproteobacteria bacterium]
MNRSFNPPTVGGPFGAYSHGCEVPQGARWLVIAGQVGAKPEGGFAEGIDAQCEWALRNVVEVLRAGNMGPPDLVKLLVCLSDQAYVPNWRAAREKVMGDVKPPATLIVVPALARPEYLVEVEGWAAKV